MWVFLSSIINMYTELQKSLSICSVLYLKTHKDVSLVLMIRLLTQRSCVNCARCFLKVTNFNLPANTFRILCVFSKEYTQKKETRLAMTAATKLIDFSIKHARSVFYTLTLLRSTWPKKSYDCTRGRIVCLVASANCHSI